MNIPGRVVVDRAAFFALTAAIATACHASTEPSIVATPAVDSFDAAPAPLVLQPVEGVDTATSAPVATAAPVAPAEDFAGCAPLVKDAEALANLDALCNSLQGPTCESFGETVRECKLLNQGGADGFRPAVAGAIASCLQSRSGKTAICNGVGACFHDVIKAKDACVTSDAAPRCDALVEECKASGSKVHFSRAQCLAGMSTVDDAGLAQWKHNVTLNPTHEGCTFDYFLPYYPFSKTWNSQSDGTIKPVIKARHRPGGPVF